MAKWRYMATYNWINFGSDNARYPVIGSYRPWYGSQLAHDPAFEIFRITWLPQLSHVVINVSSVVDVTSCR